ncbi:MAG: hypothetical protein ABR530_03625 [Pyrinomonadaceae bacterium]
MTHLTVFAGVLLIVAGALGYGYSRTSLTALIPAAFGLIFLVLGLIASRSESARKHAMHAVVILALIGFVLPVARLVMRFRDLDMNAAVISQLVMALVCLMLLLAGINSFVTARRNRVAGGTTVIED